MIIDKIIEAVEEELLFQGIDIFFVKDINYNIRQRLSRKKNLDKIDNKMFFLNSLKEVFNEIILDVFGNSTNDILIHHSKLNIIMLVGINGVGKTFLCMKIAKHFKNLKYQVSIANLDIEKEGAEEQLGELCQKIEVNYIIPNGNDLEKNVKEVIQLSEEKNDNILILDMPGLSLSEEKYITKLNEINNKMNIDYCFLVCDLLHCQSSKKIYQHLVEKININGLCFTKLDGIMHYGSIVNAKLATLQNIFFISTGEDAENIEIFDPIRFVDSVLNNISYVDSFDSINQNDTNDVYIKDFFDLGLYLKNKNFLDEKMIKYSDKIKKISSLLTKEENDDPILIDFQRKKVIMHNVDITMNDLNSMILMFYKIQEKQKNCNGITVNRLIYEDLIN